MEIGVQKQTDEEKQAQPEQFNKLDDSGDKKQTGYCGFLTVEYYTPYFNVTESDVIQRIKATFLPFRPDFLNITKENPDLWGPIWINATLIFMITAIANLRQVDSEKENQSFDVGYVPQATALLYIIAFGTPAILAIVMKILGVDLSFFQTICLYGYSMSTLLPITILCYFQNELFLWLIIVYGVGNSILFLIFNLKEQLQILSIQKQILFFRFVQIYYYIISMIIRYYQNIFMVFEIEVYYLIRLINNIITLSKRIYLKESLQLRYVSKISIDYYYEKYSLKVIKICKNDRELDKLQIQKKYIIIAIVVTMQLSLYLFYKLVFFSYVSEGKVETTVASSDTKEPGN